MRGPRVRAVGLGIVSCALAFAVTLVALVPALPFAASTAASAAAATTRFVAITPCRLADVREGTGFERVDATIVRVTATGRCGVPAEATAAALIVTVDSFATPTAGHVTIWPDGAPMPTASILNYGPRQIRANGTIVGIGNAGAIDLSSFNGAPVIVDVTGWFVPATTAAAGRFVPIVPTRAIDTRDAPRGFPLARGETVRVPLPAAVPPTASAVAVTVTTTQSPSAGFFTAFPAGEARPYASVLNTDGWGQTRAAGAIVAVGPDGLDVYSQNGGHLIVDVTGWFTGDDADDSTVGLFVPEPAPRRLLDTRTADPAWRDGEVEVANVAPDAAALVLNVTMVTPIASGHLTAHAARTALPTTSTVNGLTPDEVAAAMAIVPTSTVGVGVHASGGADVVVDVAGWFVGSPVAASGPAPPNVRPPECTWNTDPSGLTDFFKVGSAFTGSDYQRPFPLPDGRVLWLFQDAYVRGRGGASRLVHNAALVQHGGCFTVLYSGNYAAPRDYLFADQTQRMEHWFWPLGGDMGTDGLFHLFVAEMREHGDTYLTETEPIATWKVAIDLATMQVVDRRPATNPSAALYGWSVASSDNYTYLYAHCHRQFGWDAFPFVSPPVYVHDWGCASVITVARVPKGRFDQPLSYWNGSAWVSSASSAVNIVPNPDSRLVSASQYYRYNGKWVAITKVGDWFGTRIEVDVATNPQGPYRTVRTIPTPAKCATCNTYFASLVPYPGSDGSMIVGISNNVFGELNLSRYDPTFFAMPPV